MNYCDQCEAETSSLTQINVDDGHDGYRTEEWCEDCITGFQTGATS